MKKPTLSPKEWILNLNDQLTHSLFFKTNGRAVSFNQAYALVKKILLSTKKKNGTVWWAANGGSDSIGGHLSQDLINKLGVKSVHLGSSPLITCIANDYGYENVYSKPFETLMGKNDTLIAISSSGNSQNILNAVKVAKQKKAKTITLSSFQETNALYKFKSDLGIYLKSDLYGHAEVGHILILHAFFECFYLEQKK